MDQTNNRFERGARWVLYSFAALLPLWFVPVLVGIEFGREVTFAALIILGTLLWLLSVLTSGGIRYQYSPILWSALLLLMVAIASTLFSKTPLVSALFADATAEKLSTLVLGLLLMLLGGSIFQKMEEASTFVFILICAGAVSALATVLALIFNVSVWHVFAPFVQGKDFNVIGTINGLSLFYTILLVMTVGLVASDRISQRSEIKSWVSFVLYGALVLFVINLLSINFLTAWIVLLASSIFLFGFMFRRMWDKNTEGRKRGFDARYSLVLAMLVLSILMLFVRTPLLPNLNLPPEVSPSFKATLDIAQSSFKDGTKFLAIGSGPGTFGLNWNRFKDPSINQTVFWSVRFNQGYSWVATLLSTIGVGGTLAFLLFLGLSFFLFLKHFITRREAETALTTSVFLAFVSLGVTAFVYPSNLSLELLLFLAVGLLTFLLHAHPGEERGWFDIREHSFSFESPWTMFLSSLLSIFLIALGVAAIYFEVGQFRAARAANAVAAELQQGHLDQAIGDLNGVIQLENKNYRNYTALVQVRMQKIQDLIQRASKGENVQQDFQSQVTQAIQDSQNSIQLDSQEAVSWETQGALYELIIPFINGSERFAFSSYQRATELDPLNPVLWVDLGRTGLVYADRVQLFINQANSTDRPQLEQARASALEAAKKALERAVEVKPDYAPAHFLLTQTALRLGDLPAAIKSAENSKLAAPFDIGVAFQLGLLYYQSGDMDKAEGEFSRAVSINDNYSNARYFLGLIYSQRGEKDKAIEQFQKIQAFNPDNQEVKKILENLGKGKTALAGIVPPAQPPERRKSTPVSEQGSTK